MKKLFIKLIYGERIKGEKPTIPKKLSERTLIVDDFENWCKEFNVSVLHNKSRVYYEF